MTRKDLEKLLFKRLAKIRDLDGNIAITPGSLVFETALDTLVKVYNQTLDEAVDCTFSTIDEIKERLEKLKIKE